MQIIEDASIRLGCKPFQVFVKAYQHYGIADQKEVEAEALESWRRYRSGAEEKADDEVVDFCITVLDPRKEVAHAPQAP